MKSVFFMSAMLLSSLSFASATCPQDSQSLKACESTPKKGDSEVAAGALDSIALCRQGRDTLMVFEKNGQSETATAKVDPRAGGISYSVDANGTVFSLSFASGTRHQSKTANFTVIFTEANLEVSSTYTCQ